MICGSCGKDARRVKTLFDVGGKPLPTPKDECEHCADGGKHEDPAWLRDKPVPLWESRPWLYKKKDNPEGGYMYEPTDANLADLEAQIMKPSADDQAAIEKRRNRIVSEDSIDLAKAHALAREFTEAFEKASRDYEEANAEYWNTAAEDLRVQ